MFKFKSNFEAATIWTKRQFITCDLKQSIVVVNICHENAAKVINEKNANTLIQK